MPILSPRLIAAAAFPLLLLNLQSARAEAAGLAASQSHREQMDHISVETIGTSGSPIILIPGLATPRTVWEGVAPELAKRHRVYLVQVNGFGGDDPRNNLKAGILDGIVADVRTLIDKRKLEKPALVGHSMGGLVGLMLASRHPDSVGRLMVVDALPFFSVLIAPPGTDVTASAVEPQAAQMRTAIAASYGKPANPAMAQANAARLALKSESRARVARWTLAADPRVVAQAMYEDIVTDMRPQLKAIRAPVTVVYAWNDSFPPKERADTLFEGEFSAVPHVTFVGIGESAHFVMLDQPASFAAALNTFLAK